LARLGFWISPFYGPFSLDGRFETYEPGTLPRGVLFLHDNAPAHRSLATQKKLAYLGFQYVDHY
jgi:hypothetical protein